MLLATASSWSCPSKRMVVTSENVAISDTHLFDKVTLLPGDVRMGRFLRETASKHDAISTSFSINSGLISLRKRSPKVF